MPRLLLASLLLVSCQGPQPVVDPGLRSALQDLVAAAAPAKVCIAYHDLASGAELLIDADRVLHAASTMKVPVLIEVYRQADAGTLDLDAGMVVENRFASIVDGSPYQLTPADDSDPQLYELVGKEQAIRDLCRRMITRSSNLATNLIIQKVGAARVQRSIESLGTRRMRVLRGVEDGLAYRQGLSNTATARDLMVLMRALARGTAASPGACREMLQVLEAQEFRDLIPAGLPPGTRVAHKTGWITGIRHDAAVVYAMDQPAYVLVVLTAGFAEKAAAARAVAAVSARVHRARTGR